MSGGLASLVALDQTDNDNNATSGFAAGTHSSTQWNAGSSWVELTGAGQVAGSGDFTSRIMNAGANVSWSTIAWTPERPFYKELPGNAATETGYPAGNAAMTNNVLLLHMNEASWNGTANEVVDSSGQANHGTAGSGATTTASGRFNSGGSFDGANTYVSVADANSLDVTTAMTVEFWMKPSSTFSSSSNSAQGLIDKGAFKLMLNNDGSGTLGASISNGAGGAWTTTHDLAEEQIFFFVEYLGYFYTGVGYSTDGFGDVYLCDPAGGGDVNRCDNAADWSKALDTTDRNVEAGVVYNGKLYVGTGGLTDSGHLYACNPAGGGSPTKCDNAADWTLVYTSPSAEVVISLAVFNGYLYIGLGDHFGAGGTNGSIVVCDPAGGGVATDCDNAADFSTSLASGSVNEVDTLGVYNGKLYAGLGGNADGDGTILICNPATAGTATKCDNAADWTTSKVGLKKNILSIMPYNGFLYATQSGSGANDGKVFLCTPSTAGTATDCDNAADWTEAHSGSASFEEFDGLQVYNGKLYVGTGFDAGDASVYVCDPTGGGNAAKCDNAADWTLVYNNASELEGFSLGVYNGYLYLGTCCSGLIFDYGTDTVLRSTATSWSSSSWYHVAATYDNANFALYVNGVQQATKSAAFTMEANALPLLLGKAHASAQAFGGTLDDVALYSRALSSTEISDHYKRGAARLKYQVRSCNDNACAGETFMGPDGTGATYYTELSNSATTPPSLALTNVPANQYLQYKAFFETDDSSLSPQITSVVIGPSHYDSANPTVVNNTGTSYTTLTSFTETLGGGNAGSVQYQLSNDGLSWYYYNGAAWVAAAGYAQSNTAAVVNANIAAFAVDVGTGTIYFKAFLHSNGSQDVQLDKVDISGT